MRTDIVNPLLSFALNTDPASTFVMGVIFVLGFIAEVIREWDK
jgi:hypothetical protein